MITTIQVAQETQRILAQLRENTGAQSYNDVIMNLLKQKVSQKESLFGFLGKKSKKEIMEGLRDKDDRIL